VLCPYQLLLQARFPTATYVIIFTTCSNVLPHFHGHVTPICWKSFVASRCHQSQFPCDHCKALKQGRCCHGLQEACEYSGFQSIREIKYRVWESVWRGKIIVSTIKASYTLLSRKAIYKERYKYEKPLLCLLLINIVLIWFSPCKFPNKR